MTDQQTTLTLHDFEPSSATFLHDVLTGLREDPKQLPCKYFYDERGSALFERICELDEYYLTRTELAIMRRHHDSMAAQIGADCMLVEYGSGAGVKTRFLLDALVRPAAYVPVDISREHLKQTARELIAAYPELPVLPVCADFTARFRLPESPRTVARRIVYFPGSTIGNFDAASSAVLLREIAALVGSGGGLLIGVDLKKDPAVLEAAYNDRRGVTAEFNLNLLRRINRELGADFDVERFEHRAVYDRERGRIEMHLLSRREQTVTIDGEGFLLAAGETICTEQSHKYEIDEFGELATKAGFKSTQCWTDEKQLFAVLLLTVA